MADAPPREFSWHPKVVFDLLKRTGKEWIEDRAPNQAAALAYYSLFALGPLIVLATGIAGIVMGHEAARSVLVNLVVQGTGGESRGAIEDLVGGAMGRELGPLGVAGGFLLLLLVAAGVFGQLKESLNRVWEVRERKYEGWKAKIVDFARDNALKFAAVLTVGLLVLASLVANTALAAAQAFVGDPLPGSEFAWRLLGFLVSLVLLSGAFAILFQYLPDAQIARKDVAIGAVVTAILFVAGQAVLSWYLGTGRIGERFGAGGALVVILVWFYYSGLIFFFGAEFTQVYSNLYGSRVRPDEGGRTMQRGIREDHDPPPKEGTEGAKRRRPGDRGAT